MKIVDEILNQFSQAPINQEVKEYPFGDAVWPWIGTARKRLEGVEKRLLKDEALFSLEKSILLRCCQICAPSFVLEMTIHKNSNQLIGNTPHERYLSFVNDKLLNTSNLNVFFEEYSELARMISVYLDLWEVQAKEFLTRLHKDYDALCTTFNQGLPLGKVVNAKLGMGDPHNGGRSVYLLTFECGKTIFYKPKDLNIVEKYHEFLDELGKMGLQPLLKGYSVLLGDGYGWEEMVEHKECANQKEVRLYFQRAGMHLATLTLLGGNDCHHENIIAHGEHPMFIDLETLFQCKLTTKELRAEMPILNTGLLPSYIMGKFGNKGIDISGLGATSGQNYPSYSAKWDNKNTDEMRLIYEFVQSSTESNQVRFQGKQQNAHDHVVEIVLGFKKTYTFLYENREKIRLLLESMRGCKARFILRATRFYFHILQRLRDPTNLLHEGERKKELTLLETYLPESRHAALVESEKKSILQGDVPSFTAKTDEKHIYAEDHIVLKDAFEKSAFEVTIDRLEAMCEQDLALQETLIRQAFILKTTQTHSLSEEECVTNKNLASIPSTTLLDYAKSIGQRLKNQAIILPDGKLAWVDLEPDPVVDQYQLQPISNSLYGGKTGLALFFAALAKVTKEKEWEEMAHHTLAELLEKIESGEEKKLIGANGLGGFSGAGGTIYALNECGKLLDAPHLRDAAKKLLQGVETRHLDEDIAFDVIAGSAGFLLSLLSFEDPSSTHLGDAVANHLLKNASKMPRGFGWKSFGRPPLLGFSHGVAGIAYSLFRWGSHTKNEQWTECAKEALEYERSHFDAKEMNWPSFSKANIFPSRWCHGATGIGLSRMAIYEHYRDEIIDQEIDVAIETTMKKMHEGAKVNLCCTSLGRLEFLMECSQLKGQGHKKTALESVPTIFSRLDTTDSFSPGLMQGNSGVGYTLLRIIDPTLPQVLLLR